MYEAMPSTFFDNIIQDFPFVAVNEMTYSRNHASIYCGVTTMMQYTNISCNSKNPNNNILENSIPNRSNVIKDCTL